MATLGRLGLSPSGDEMVRALSQMDVPMFGVWVRQVFLFSAVAVPSFRHRDLDARLAPRLAWDVLLWLSAAGFVVAAGWTVRQKLGEFLTK